MTEMSDLESSTVQAQARMREEAPSPHLPRPANRQRPLLDCRSGTGAVWPLCPPTIAGVFDNHPSAGALSPPLA